MIFKNLVNIKMSGDHKKLLWTYPQHFYFHLQQLMLSLVLNLQVNKHFAIDISLKNVIIPKNSST